MHLQLNHKERNHMKYTKKFLVVILAVGFLLLLSACSADGGGGGEYVPDDEVQGQVADTSQESADYTDPANNAGSDAEEPSDEESDEPYAEPGDEEPEESDPEPAPDTTAEPADATAEPPREGTFVFPFNFSTEDLYGGTVTHEALGYKEAFFVYLWTTWCPSCVDAMPYLAQLAEAYGDRVGFISLLGDFDTAGDTAIRIKEDAGVPFITVDANYDGLQDLLALVRSGFVPTSVVIGQDGTVVGEQIVGSGIDRFQAAIEYALGG